MRSKPASAKKCLNWNSFFDRITGCRVVVERHHRSRSNLTAKDQPFHVSIVVDVPGEELVVKRDPKDFSALKQHQDVNIAVRDAFATMQRRLKEYVARRWRNPPAPPGAGAYLRSSSL